MTHPPTLVQLASRIGLNGTAAWSLCYQVVIVGSNLTRLRKWLVWILRIKKQDKVPLQLDNQNVNCSKVQIPSREREVKKEKIYQKTNLTNWMIISFKLTRSNAKRLESI